MKRLVLALLTCGLLAVAGPASARDLTIGLIPEQNVFTQLERYEPVGRYLERRTGLQVRFTLLSRYGNILTSFTEQGMDAAFWGSFTGALAIERLNTVPIARPVWLDGTSTYHGLIFTRRDSGIRSVEQMRGRTLAFVDKATTAGYVFPLAYFRDHGVADPDTFFGATFFAGSHDAAITAVLDGHADVGCAKNTIYQAVAARNPRLGSELQILATSPHVPSNGLGVRADVPAAERAALQQALLTMDQDSQGREVLRGFGAKRFIPTSREDYRPVFELAADAGIDLGRYDYSND